MTFFDMMNKGDKNEKTKDVPWFSLSKQWDRKNLSHCLHNEEYAMQVVIITLHN